MIDDFRNQWNAEDIKSLRQIDGILDKRIRYMERRVWPMFILAFVLISLLFCTLLLAATII